MAAMISNTLILAWKTLTSIYQGSNSLLADRAKFGMLKAGWF
jgi:hypothetical protein